MIDNNLKLFSSRINNRNQRTIGAEKESLAEKFLIAQGLILVARNYHCRMGEIDLILNDEMTLVFVEVRFRRSIYYGHPSETVNQRKQKKLITTAEHYLQNYPTTLPCRFDVIAIYHNDNIKWIQRAFIINN